MSSTEASGDREINHIMSSCSICISLFLLYFFSFFLCCVYIFRLNFLPLFVDFCCSSNRLIVSIVSFILLSLCFLPYGLVFGNIVTRNILFELENIKNIILFFSLLLMPDKLMTLLSFNNHNLFYWHVTMKTITKSYFMYL